MYTMPSRTQVIIRPNNLGLKEYKVLLTNDQIKLLEWLSENALLWTEVTYTIVDQEEFVSIE